MHLLFDEGISTIASWQAYTRRRKPCMQINACSFISTLTQELAYGSTGYANPPKVKRPIA